MDGGTATAIALNAHDAVRRVEDLASRLQLGRLVMPDRKTRVDVLLGEDAPGTYDYLSGLAHAEPASIHHVLSFARERGEESPKGVAVVAALTLVPLVRAHARAFNRYLDLAQHPDDVEADLDVLVPALTTAAIAAAPAG